MTTPLTERIARLGPAQRELLERRLDTPPAAKAPLVARSSGGPAPASPTQKSMWFVHHLDPASPVFNNGNAVRIRGLLDVAALSGALADLVERHEVLRTNYRLVDGELMQFVQPPPGTLLEIRETPAPPGDLPGEVGRQIETEASRPFDLETDLMYRAVLFRLSDEDHVLVRSSHHIAFDRWSVAIANEELAELYRARRAGTEPKVPDLPVQYTDFARWQLDMLASDTAGARLRFFTSHIAGVSGYLDVPTDHPRVQAQGPATTLTRPLPADLSTRIRGVARDLGATPFMLLLAVYGALMGRFTRSDQLIVGVPVALRGEPELTDMLGPFINTVALRLDLRGEPTFGELVERTRRTSLNMIAHQDLPFDELVRAVAPDRVANRTPLFQVMFDYLNTPHTPLELEGLDLEWAPLEPPTTAHDITLYIEDQPSGIACRWEYRADLFDRATVGALAGAFEVMVERLVAAPGTLVGEVGLLDDRDEKRVRSLGAGPDSEVEASHVLEALEAQRSKAPEAVAIESEGKAHTYDDLALTARRVAEALGGQGVRPGDTVALLLDRSVDLVAGLLGVIMAGGTAVLLDRDQPERRLAAMLDAIAPALLLADPGLEYGPPTVTFDSLVADAPEATTPSFSPLAPLGPSDPAYVVFTSGSTGAPKGVVVGHGSLHNFVTAAVSAYGIGSEDRVLQFASPGFDTFVEEVFPALATGATVVLRPVELFPTFTAFEDFVAESGVTVLDLPTAWWSSWVSDLGEKRRPVPPGVRMVIVGGEAARADVWRDWTRVAGDVRWVNSYGPSEGTVVVATFEPSPAYRPAGAVMPIGRPIQNASLLVVDPDGHPLPPRLTGELVIEGAPVALGYVAPPSALPPPAEGVPPSSALPPLAEGVPPIEDRRGGWNDPPTLVSDGDGFETDASGRRRYRTGDLARLLPDGTFEFVGRIDSQVKVRGTRVEPAEVEAALREHPGIADAVVVPDRDGEPGLVGHVVATDADLDGPSIRRHLVGRLPEPMIPSAWQFHESLPMTPGGKPDRRLLERVDTVPKPERNGRVRPRSEMETKLFEIWEGVLGTSDISVTDSFFDLGGHSLLGVKMISRISSTLDLTLPLRAIFETPTIESMARALEGSDA